MKLTNRTKTNSLSMTDLFHIVKTGDTTQDPSGSSYSAEIGQIFGMMPSVNQIWTTGSTGVFSIKANNGTLIDATGNFAHAEGFNTKAYGNYSHAEGWLTIASGESSHAEGWLTIASGKSSHAEGYETQSIGEQAHAEGFGSIASGDESHAEGHSTKAMGHAAHSQGLNTVAMGLGSTSSGFHTLAAGIGSYAGGRGGDTDLYTKTIEQHLTGGTIIASGDTSFIHYRQTTKTNTCGAYGDQTAILGGIDHRIDYGAHNSAILGGVRNLVNPTVENSVVLGGNNIVATRSDTVYVPDLVFVGINEELKPHVLTIDSNGLVFKTKIQTLEPYWTIGDGLDSISTLRNKLMGGFASGDYSHAEGYNSVASGEGSFVFGRDSIASGKGTVVFGNSVTGSIDNTTYVNKLSIKSYGTYANDAAADADLTLPSGGIYTLNGSRALYIKP